MLIYTIDLRSIELASPQFLTIPFIVAFSVRRVCLIIWRHESALIQAHTEER